MGIKLKRDVFSRFMGSVGTSERRAEPGPNRDIKNRGKAQKPRNPSI